MSKCPHGRLCPGRGGTGAPARPQGADDDRLCPETAPDADGAGHPDPAQALQSGTAVCPGGRNDRLAFLLGLFGDLLACLAGFRQAYGDCLLSAFHRPAGAAFQRARLALMHHLLDLLLSAFGIFPCHGFVLMAVRPRNVTSEIKFRSGKERRTAPGVAFHASGCPWSSAMMITLSRLYPDGAVARAVVDELKAAGLPEDDIGIIAPTRSRPMKNADLENAGDNHGQTVNRSAGIGAALGGAAGLLAGLGAFVLPGIGAVVAAGWLASALAGAVAGGAAGGVVGALIEAGISENDAADYAEGVRRGGTLLTIRVMSPDRHFYHDIVAGGWAGGGMGAGSVAGGVGRQGGLDHRLAGSALSEMPGQARRDRRRRLAL